MKTRFSKRKADSSEDNSGTKTGRLQNDCYIETYAGPLTPDFSESRSNRLSSPEETKPSLVSEPVVKTIVGFQYGESYRRGLLILIL